MSTECTIWGAYKTDWQQQGMGTVLCRIEYAELCQEQDQLRKDWLDMIAQQGGTSVGGKFWFVELRSLNRHGDLHMYTHSRAVQLMTQAHHGTRMFWNDGVVHTFD